MSEETMLKEASGAAGVGAKRPRSPQPSTSAASTPSAASTLSAASTPSAISTLSAASTPSASEPQRLSVYSHIEGIQEIGQLRGLRTGRRRARFRGMRRSISSQKYEQAMSILEPVFTEETLRMHDAQALVAAAIEHFANTVCGIVDHLEGKERQLAYALKIEKFKKRVEEERAKRAGRSVAEEAAGGAERTREEAQEGRARRLQREAQAAVEALRLGDPRGERLPPLTRLADHLAVVTACLERHDTDSDED